MPKKQHVCHYCLRLVPYDVFVDDVKYVTRIFVLTHKDRLGSIGNTSRACTYCYLKIKPFFRRQYYRVDFNDLYLLAQKFPPPVVLQFEGAKEITLGGWTLSSKEMLRTFGVQLPVEVEATFGIDFQQKTPTEAGARKCQL